MRTLITKGLLYGALSNATKGIISRVLGLPVSYISIGAVEVKLNLISESSGPRLIAPIEQTGAGLRRRIVNFIELRYYIFIGTKINKVELSYKLIGVKVDRTIKKIKVRASFYRSFDKELKIIASVTKVTALNNYISGQKTRHFAQNRFFNGSKISNVDNNYLVKADKYKYSRIDNTFNGNKCLNLSTKVHLSGRKIKLLKEKRIIKGTRNIIPTLVALDLLEGE